MRKYFKWFMLGIFIISVIITLILFFNFIKDHDTVYTDNELNQNSPLSIIYGKKWRRTGVAHYEGGLLVSDNMDLEDFRFMVFTEDYVEYCDMYGEDCDKYHYEYNDGIIFIDSEDYLIIKGTYNIVFDEEIIELSIEKDNYKYIYYLS